MYGVSWLDLGGMSIFLSPARRLNAATACVSGGGIREYPPLEQTLSKTICRGCSRGGYIQERPQEDIQPHGVER